MSDVDILKNQLDEANKTVADLREKLETLSDKASSANVAKFESLISDLKVQIAKLTDEHKSVTNDLAESSAKVEELTKVKEEAEAKIQNAEAEKVRTNRVSVLVDGGIDKAEAEETVETFSDLNDKQFEHIANTIVEAKKDKAEDEDDDEKKKKDDEKAKGSDSDDDEANASDDSKILDDAELDGDGAEGASESDDEAEVLAETRASMASYFGTRLGQPVPTENNGE